MEEQSHFRLMAINYNCINHGNDAKIAETRKNSAEIMRKVQFQNKKISPHKTFVYLVLLFEE